MDKESLKDKLDEIALTNDRSRISFITALLTANGYTYVREYDKVGEAFSDYARLNGKDVYFDVQDKLLKEGIITIKTNEYNSKILQFNIDTNDTDELKKFSIEYAKNFVDKATDHFLNIIDNIMSTNDGLYILTGLAMSSKDNYVSSNTISHISSVIGQEKADIIFDKLYREGILIYMYISKSFGFLSALKPLIFVEEEGLQDALKYIYIAQDVKEEGFGVASLDCTKYRDQLDTLYKQGFIDIKRWHSLQLYVTTNKGKNEARRIINGIINRKEIDKVVSKIPDDILSYISTIVKYPIKVKFEDTPIYNHCKYKCLLTIDRLKDAYEDLINKISRLGLVVNAHNYVLTRGGELRDEYRLVAKEFIDYLNSKVKEYKLPLPDDLEVNHKVLHIIKDAYKFDEHSNEIKVHESYHGMVGLDNIVLRNEMQELVRRGIARYSPEHGHWAIKREYIDEVIDNYLRHIKDYILGKEEAPTIISKSKDNVEIKGDLADILVDIYIKQNIHTGEGRRDSGSDYNKDKIDWLINNGFIEEEKSICSTYSYRGNPYEYEFNYYVTTDKGSEVAKKLLLSRCKDAEESIIKVLNGIPKNTILLILELLKNNRDFKNYIYSKPEEEIKEQKHLCFFSDELIKEYRDRLLMCLISYNLAVKYEFRRMELSSSGYSARPISNLMYYVPNEVADYLTQLVSKKISDDLTSFDEELEDKHIKLHLLDIHYNKSRSELFDILSGGKVSFDKLNDLVEELIRDGILREDKYGKLVSTGKTDNYRLKLKEELTNYILGKEEKLPPPPPPQPPPSQEGIVIGAKSIKDLKQYGIIGKSNGKLCYIDLNAPHIVFVCGKMGSGKGYTIGVITEMLARKSIKSSIDNNISNVEKPATIIVLYKPKANENRSEFYSMIYENDNANEANTLRKEYGVEPTKLFNNDELRVFVDPNVYKNADLLAKFKEEYNTENIYPLSMDPSELGGEEWAMILASGSSKDALYIKQIFKIIQDLSLSKGKFSIDILLDRIREDEKLNVSQKRLAESRLDILQDYLKGQDFVGKLALGGINIIDLRYTLRTPDDDFAVLTLVLNTLLAKRRLREEPLAFVINEAHQYFRGDISKEFVDRLEYLIRKKRHNATWLLLDTHEPDDIDDKVIKFSDIKIVHFLDKLSESKELNILLKGSNKNPDRLMVGEAIIVADESSNGKQKPILVNIRPRITKHGGETRVSIR